MLEQLHPARSSTERGRLKGKSLANRDRLAENRTNIDTLAGPVRKGLCLLQSLLLCGICGQHLTVRSTGNGDLYAIYECNWRSREGPPRRHCTSLPAGPVDDTIPNGPGLPY